MTGLQRVWISPRITQMRLRKLLTGHLQKEQLVAFRDNGQSLENAPCVEVRFRQSRRRDRPVGVHGHGAINRAGGGKSSRISQPAGSFN